MKKSNIKTILNICLALFSVIFINISLSKKLGFYESLRGGNTLLYVIIFFCFYQIISKANAIKDKRMSIIALIIAVILSGFEIVGKSINAYLDLSGILKNNITILKSLVRMFSLTIILYSIIKIIYSYILSYQKNSKKKENIETSNNENGTKKRIFFISWGIILISWIPYLLQYFPGAISPDSMSQITQGLGIIGLTTHHPIFHTGIISIVMHIGKLFNNYNIGVAIYSIMQMITMSAIFAYTIYYMRKIKVNKYISLIALAFYAFYPVHAMYSITMWKDILFAGVMLLYLIIIDRMIRNEEKYFLSKMNIFKFIIVMILVFLTRNNGIYVILLSIPFFFVLLRKHYKKLIISFAVVIVAYVFVNGPLLSIMHIRKGSTREALSIPLQQFARVTRDHEETLTDEEKASIYKFLPTENLGEIYYEKISDQVKKHFDDKAFAENKVEFIELWIKLGIKYPRTYIESFLCNSYGYWYPEAIHWVVADNIYEGGTPEELELKIKENNIIDSKAMEKMVSEITSRKIPVIDMIFSIGFVFWIFTILLGFNIYNKNYKSCLVYLPILFLWLTCLASPVFGEFRYIYSLFTTIPFLIAINFSKPTIDNNKE